MKKLLVVSVLAMASASLCAPSAMAAKDNFNRSELGKNWVIPFGSLYINNNELQGDTGSLGYDKQSKKDSTVSATVYTTGTDLEYGAVASGDIASGNNAFVKIQADTGTGLFDNGAFYVGNNGGGSFFALNSPVPSPAKLSVSFCGTVATMKIKSSAGTQKYTYDYGTTFGTGGGLGTYGSVSLDNYKSSPGGGCKFDKGATVISKSTSSDRSLQK